MFEHLPYTNIQDLNLDWMIEKVKNAISNTYNPDNPPPYPVTSINGKTGAVRLTGNDIEYAPGWSLNGKINNKQDILNVGAGIKMEGSKISVDLARWMVINSIGFEPARQTEVVDIKTSATNAVNKANEAIEAVAQKTDKHLLTYDGTYIREGDTVLTHEAIYNMLLNSPSFVVLVYNNRAYHPNTVTTSQIVFISSHVSGGYEEMERISISSNNAVTLTNGRAEMMANKTQIINDSNKSNENKYPSLKAVADYVETVTSPIKSDMSDLSDDIDSINQCFTGGGVEKHFTEDAQKKSPASASSVAEYNGGVCTIKSNGVSCYFGWTFDTEEGKEYEVKINISRSLNECYVVRGTNANNAHLCELSYNDGVYTGTFTAASTTSTVYIYVTWNVSTVTINDLYISYGSPKMLSNNAINSSNVVSPEDDRPVQSSAVYNAIGDIVYIKNILPVGTVLSHGYINNLNGDFASQTGTASYMSTKEYIPVPSETEISISAWYDVNKLRTGLRLQVVAFYRADKSFISALGNFASASTTVQTDDHRFVTTPQDCAFIRFCFFTSLSWYDGIFSNPQVEIGQYWTDYSEPQKVVPKDKQSHWSGKKWVAIGDSITARPGNYVQSVATALGLDATNAGISGAGARTMRECFSDPSSADYHQEWHDAIANADLVTIYGCINNFGRNAQPIGDLYNTQEGTFIYQFKQLIDAVFTINPNCRLIVIGTHNAWDDGSGYLPAIYQPCGSGTDTVAEYVNAVGMVARYYGCPYIDMYNLSGFNSFNGATYLADCLHPNAKGYDRISKILIEEIERVPY